MDNKIKIISQTIIAIFLIYLGIEIYKIEKQVETMEKNFKCVKK